jgi:hypothetical protein
LDRAYVAQADATASRKKSRFVLAVCCTDARYEQSESKVSVTWLPWFASFAESPGAAKSNLSFIAQ